MRFLIDKGIGQSLYFPTIDCLREELVKRHKGQQVCLQYKKACGNTQIELVKVTNQDMPCVTTQENELFDWNRLEAQATGQFYA